MSYNYPNPKSAKYSSAARAAARATRQQDMAEIRAAQRAERAHAARAAAVPGVTRTGGYYGRFAGAGGEMKFLDTSLTNAAVDAAMEQNNLCVIPQGDTESQRVGRKVIVKKINVHATHTMPARTDIAAASSMKARYALVLDTQTNGAAFSATDLFETDSVNSFRNLANQTRFKILKEISYDLKCSGAAPSGAAYVAAGDQVTWNMQVKCNIPIEFDNSATTGAITTVRSNCIFLISRSSVANISDLAGTARIRYSDN